MRPEVTHLLTPLTAANAAAVAALFDIAQSEGGSNGWTSGAIEDAIRNSAFGVVITTDQLAVLGAALALTAGPDAEVANIVVDNRYRGAGLGKLLLTRLIEQASSAGFERLLLEVAEDNTPAKALYMNAGFDKIGGRPGYYRRNDTKIDADVMALVLPG
ncbi:MAG: GNAT family N-acetyltransferase [Alphaproteobacteria bacterium]